MKQPLKMTKANLNTPLHWRIEAFREYLTYETLQTAATVFSLYEYERWSIKNPKIIEMQGILISRTQKTAWIPSRAGSEDIDWNVEGDITRNKGRVFTSMLILYPKQWTEDKLILTEFGRALAKGRVTKHQYYDFIISRFKYPHPAWEDNWEPWTAANKKLYPFLYIIQVLVNLYQIEAAQAYLTVQEVADYLHPNPDHTQTQNYASTILASRSKNTPAINERSDQIHRKISDIFGFLCLSQYCFYNGNNVHLNLLTTHNLEKASYWEKRIGESKLEKIQALIASTLSQT